MKEVHYFDLDRYYERGDDWYQSHFTARCPTSASECQTMDNTPDYSRSLYGTKVVSRMVQTLAPVRDRVRFLLVIREPISRELSWYNHQRSLLWPFGKKCNQDSFEQYIECRGEENLLETIDTAVAQFWRHFGTKQLMVLSTTLIQQNLSAALPPIGRFLGLDKSRAGAWYSKTELPRVNEKPNPNKLRLEDVQNGTICKLIYFFNARYADFQALVNDGRGPPEQPFFDMQLFQADQWGCDLNAIAKRCIAEPFQPKQSRQDRSANWHCQTVNMSRIDIRARTEYKGDGRSPPAPSPPRPPPRPPPPSPPSPSPRRLSVAPDAPRDDKPFLMMVGLAKPHGPWHCWAEHYQAVSTKREHDAVRAQWHC